MTTPAAGLAEAGAGKAPEKVRPVSVGRRVGSVVDALAGVALPSRSRVLAAEAGGVLRWAAEPVVGRGRGLTAVVDSPAVAARLVALLTRLGVEDGTVHADPARGRWRVVLGDGHGAEVAVRVGLVGPRGRGIAGLAPWVLAGSLPEAVATWRGALLAAGRLAPREEGGAEGREDPSLVLPCPSAPVARGMGELGGRLGVRGRTPHAPHAPGAPRELVVDAPGEAGLLLASCGGAAALVAAGLAPAVSDEAPGSANRTRAAVAASRATATVADAFAVLESAGVRVPGTLGDAGRLRLRHPEVGLEELAALADAPISKDALAGRLRRLGALAARHRRAAGPSRS